MEAFLFTVVALLAIGFATGMLLSRNAVHSALFLIGNFGCVAFLYLMLDAPFLAMVQIAVYAGAIMVLFLFVIMLLGTDEPEESHDTTTRRFNRLGGVAALLVVVLIAALAGPIIINNFQLPATPGKAPLVRIVQAAALPAVDIEVSGGGLTEPWVLDDFNFGDRTEFKSLPAGDYTVKITDATSGTPVALPATVTLQPDTTQTLVAGGEVNLDAQPAQLVQLFTVVNDLQPVNNDSGRFVVFNGYTAEPLTLIDLGPDQVISTDTRDGNLVIIDPIIAENAAYLGAPVVGKYTEGTYTLGFVKPVYDATGKLSDYTIVQTIPQKVVADTENDMLLVKDGNEDASASLIGNVRSTLIPNLTIDTVPTFGSPLSIGRILFTVYLLPVNLVGLLLLVALVGVIVISRPSGEKQERRSANLRRRVSRPLVNVISQQTGGDVVVETPKLGSGSEE